MNTYKVRSKAVPSGVWLTVAGVKAKGFADAIRKARCSDLGKDFKHWPHWEATLIQNVTGKNLGRTRTVEIPIASDLSLGV